MAVLYPNPFPVKMDWNRALRDLPEFGENLSALEHLEVNNCYLSSLPETINTMKSLATLNCQSNQLESLPSDLVLPALDLFNCWRCRRPSASAHPCASASSMGRPLPLFRRGSARSRSWSA